MYIFYCRNIFKGNIWGDDVMLGAIGHMWNISITIVMPCSNPLHLFHDNYKDPDLVIVVNGGLVESSYPATHFYATKSRLVNQKVPGSKVVKLTPKTYDSYEFGLKVSHNRMEDRLKCTVFDRLRQVNFEIDTLDNEIGKLNNALKDAKQLRGNLEKDLLKLGFNIQELRTLRKGQVLTSESYVPEQSEKLPEYTPTPKTRRGISHGY